MSHYSFIFNEKKKKKTILFYVGFPGSDVSALHELPRNRPAVRRKWIKFIQFKRADFLAAPHHAHFCSEHFSECDFANPMEYRLRFASKLTRCSGTLSKSCLTGSN